MSEVRAVGQDEEALASMASTGLRRAEYSARNPTPQSLQCWDGDCELSGEVPRYVLAEEGFSPAFVVDLDCAVEQPAIVSLAEPFACDAVSLAGIARQDAIHSDAPRSSIEGSEVRPDSSRMKPPRFHARDQACGCASFPLYESDTARVGSSDAHSEVESSDAGADADGT